MKRPAGTLDDLTMPKRRDAAPAIMPGAPRSLSCKLDPDLYLRLRQHCLAEMERTGTAPTHQEVLTTALRRFLGV
jgi:hypothetical protein